MVLTLLVLALTAQTLFPYVLLPLLSFCIDASASNYDYSSPFQCPTCSVKRVVLSVMQS